MDLKSGSVTARSGSGSGRLAPIKAPANRRPSSAAGARPATPTKRAVAAPTPTTTTTTGSSAAATTPVAAAPVLDASSSEQSFSAARPKNLSVAVGGGSGSGSGSGSGGGERAPSPAARVVAAVEAHIRASPRAGSGSTGSTINPLRESKQKMNHLLSYLDAVEAADPTNAYSIDFEPTNDSPALTAPDTKSKSVIDAPPVSTASAASVAAAGSNGSNTASPALLAENVFDGVRAKMIALKSSLDDREQTIKQLTTAIEAAKKYVRRSHTLTQSRVTDRLTD